MSFRLSFCLGLCLAVQLWSASGADQTNRPGATETNRLAFLKETFRSMDSLDNKQKLGPGDRIAYRVIEDQDEPRELLVTDSGDLEVPYLGLIHAAGKTSRLRLQPVSARAHARLIFPFFNQTPTP